MFEKDYSFTGKHAEYVENLVNKDEAELFKRNLDVYILAPIIGKLYGKKVKKESGEQTTKIFTEQLLKEKTKLEFIYKSIILTENEYSEEEKIDHVFRGNNDLKAGEKIYDEYVLGGVEVLHEKLYEENLNKEDYLDNLFKFVKEFNDDLEIREDKTDINEIIAQYE